MEVKCPTCEKSVTWSKESEFKPFCSERCRLIDLGQWAAEEHRIPCTEQEMSLETNETISSEPIQSGESSENLH